MEEGRNTDGIKAGLQMLDEARRADNAEDIASAPAVFLLGLSA